MERKFKFSEQEYYHVYNRGVEKRDIFLDNKDRERFLKLLFLCNGSNRVIVKDLPQGRPLGEVDRGEKLVDIGVYCLMPNHFHILIKEIKSGGVTKFMSKLSTSYSMYFNSKYKRSGALFQGKFGAGQINDDNHLKYLFAYIHLNPIKIIDPLWKEKGINNLALSKKFLQEYKYSSYCNYTEQGHSENIILTKESFPDYFEDDSGFDYFIDQWLNYKEIYNPQGRPLGEVIHK